ncbi:thiamine pyrophosphate-binding protein [uncultured Methanolobus sp.]|uniref:thiamine pyrophosphate-binding protein n=1 Tax=uncultured Methanolobus sp. TaxID=218300 RepID=UPI002AAB4753|nr:thiamine pyrophosphate-binding protein [uncultured Methanolobus sp.]
MIRVADYIADFIVEKGVKHAFMLSGGGIMHLTDGLACKKEKLEAICCHHEQAASMALEAYSRTSENFGVGYFTTGPGATNAVTGLVGAWVDSVPCMFISGQVKRKETIYNANIPGLRQFGVQEVNIIPVVESITKYSVMINEPEMIRYHLEKAFYMAKSGRPGPVWIDIPLDVQGALIDPKQMKGFDEPETSSIHDTKDIEQVVALVKESSRPVILAGQGIRLAGAVDKLSDFCGKYDIPVVTSYLGIDSIDSYNKCFTGRIGIKGDRAGNLAMQNSDLLIVIGSSLPVAEIGYDYDQFAREAKIIVVDIELASHLKNTIKIDMLIQDDAKEFIEKMDDFIEPENMVSKEDWLKTCTQWSNKYPVCLPEYADLKEKINKYYFINKLSEICEEDDVIVTDAGSAFYAGSQGVKLKKGMRYITSGGLATMGYSLPASIGASLANDRKRIMCITGDGSFQQNIQELQTVLHYGLPIKIFVLNNEGYLSIRFTQGKYFEQRFIGESKDSGVSFPSLESISNAYGIKYFRADKNSQLKNILEAVMDHNGPVICEIINPRDQLIIPTVASEKLEDGSMVSKPLEDMYPFLERDEFKNEMIIDTIHE